VTSGFGKLPTLGEGPVPGTVDAIAGAKNAKIAFGAAHGDRAEAPFMGEASIDLVCGGWSFSLFARLRPSGGWARANHES
jgi:hypothetical protein